MQALLLAAGRSRRFWPLPDKNFLNLGGKTLIEYQIAALKKAGIKKVVIVGGAHNVTQLRELFPKCEIVEQLALDDGMAGAVLAARKQLTEPTVILSTNDIFDPAAIKRLTSASDCDGALLAQKVTGYFPGGYLSVDGDGFIRGIVEKPGAGNEPSDLVNIVCHLFNDPQALVGEIEKILPTNLLGKRIKPKTDDLYERALDSLFQTQSFKAIDYIGAWQAVKYPWHVLAVMQHFLSSIRTKKAKGVQIAKTAVINGPVVIEEGVKIFDFAVIQGPVWLGKNAVIGTGSLVRNSIIGAGCVVGSQSEVARSYLGANVWLHRNYLGDSVIADNVSFGSGAVTGNLRLDEKEINVDVQGKRIPTGGNKLGTAIGEGCRLGVNTSIMPGVFVGTGSFVGSGLVLAEHIADRSFVTGETKLKVRENKAEIKPRTGM